MAQIKNILPQDGQTNFFPDFFSSSESATIFQFLQTEILWRHEPIILFGKKIMQPRLTAWLGDEGKSYSYSGITMHPQKWTQCLLGIKNRVEDVAEYTFNSALLNQYRDQNDSVGWHRDDEKELGENPVIASVSFGATRTFQFRHKEKPELKRSVELTNGSFLLMKGTTQHHWLHCIPKSKKVLGPRINITFRFVV